jgi:hypothetical protein
MPKFAYAPDKRPIYGIFHPFVFNNTGNQHGGKPITGEFWQFPHTGFPQKLSLFSQSKKNNSYDFIRGGPYMGNVCRGQQNLISYLYMVRDRSNEGNYAS